ncbi:MAG: 3-hydroxyacyl-ACP dehydratase FabZ [Burkholderiales bacterium]|nr:3-hydroxyacyl-ACP dehydratase FabZ [Burkholderiales bacterium]
MGIREVLQYLPHRYPFLLIDRVISCEPGRTITAVKNVTINEPFFMGHFPHHPIMPGVMIIEALAQAAAILSFRTMNHRADERVIYYFVGIDRARFKRPVGPGDTLLLEVSLRRQVRNIWMFKCVARVGDAIATEAEVMCTIRPVDSPVDVA